MSKEGQLRFPFVFCILLLKLLDSSRAIKKLLLSCEKRVTAGTNLDTYLLFCIHSLICGAARACDNGLVEFRMNVLFHNPAPKQQHSAVRLLVLFGLFNIFL